MEDACFVERCFRARPDEALFAVFDGHSGSDVAEQAALGYAQLLADILGAAELPTDPAEVDAAMAKAYADLNERNQAKPVVGGAVAVAVLLKIEGGGDGGASGCSCRLYCSNVGDARAVLARSVSGSGSSVSTPAGDGDGATSGADGGETPSPRLGSASPMASGDAAAIGSSSTANATGAPSDTTTTTITTTTITTTITTCALAEAGVRAVRISRDFKPFDDDEYDRIVSLGGFVSLRDGGRVCDDLALTRSLGDLHLGRYVEPRPHFHSERFGAAEAPFIILACDGVWDALDDDEACAAVLACAPEYTRGASALRDLAFVHGSTDNISALVIDLTPLATSV